MAEGIDGKSSYTKTTYGESGQTYGHANVSPLSMGPLHMSNVYDYEIQRTNNFELVLDEYGNWFTLSVDSCSIPTISNTAIELSYGNSKVKVAGPAEFESVSLVVKDFILLDVEYQLWQWRRQVYDPATDRIGWAQDYKKNGYIYQYGPDGSCARGWRMLGIWPENFESGELNYDGGDKKSITMNLNVDKAFPIEGQGRTNKTGSSTKGTYYRGMGNYSRNTIGAGNNYQQGWTAQDQVQNNNYHMSGASVNNYVTTYNNGNG